MGKINPSPLLLDTMSTSMSPLAMRRIGMHLRQYGPELGEASCAAAWRPLAGEVVEPARGRRLTHPRNQALPPFAIALPLSTNSRLKRARHGGGA